MITQGGRGAGPGASSKRRSLWPVALVLALLIALALIVGACGGGTSSKSSASPSATQLTSFAGKAQGDVSSITWGLPYGEPDTVNPWNSAYYSSGLIAANTCDYLLRMQENGDVGPGLATSWKQPDPKTTVYTIRQGVKFWDGTPLTAADVVYSLKRASSPDALVSFFFANVASIQATGPYEVTIHFTKPDELLHRELSTFVGAVVEKKWGEKVGAALGTPKGGLMASGPFKLDKWTPGQGIELSRNDAYWDPQYKARAAQVSVKFVSDSTALSQALSSGELDGAWEVPFAIIPSLRNASSGTLYLGPSRQYYEIMVMRPDGPLADQNLRKAINISLDRTAVTEKIFNNAGEACYTLLDPNTWDPATLDAWKTAYQPFVTEYAYNLDAAKQLVANSKYSGQPVTLLVQAGDQTAAEVAQLVQQSGKEIGLTVQIKTMQAIEYNKALVSADARKGIDLALSSSFNGVTDPVEPITFQVLPTSFYNYTGYNDPQVTALVTKAQQTFDATARTQMLVKAQSLYEPAQAATSLVAMNEVSFLNKRLSGMTTSFNYLFVPSLATIGSAQ